ncbi:50S ribosomal protein L15 [Planctomyces sp. SH-PL14]|uniref:50S ribosomal protein L15 n=1 Tax=Planctomyces sp. SH-PL14 TaxID=1632864 RepID=UPI00078CD93B|nr:50S ribosomal protein L15 [Planctomyces sp. SH-PL14]AMV21244.1 50S ribosomal protein L15 [Planctomyces sp. SH-PL14]
MIIHDVHQGIHAHKPRKRIGRGCGSGHGKTSGRGHKGQGSRRGSAVKANFEGGQKPLLRLVAKRGFNNRAHAPKILEINLKWLELKFESGAVVNEESLKTVGLAKGRYDVIKVLGNGDLNKKLTVQAHRFSAQAEQKIQAAGGTVEKILS